ncbi:MAG: hypothetical protein E7099_05495 [Mediterranea massiliensis]|nr:hypothetical protein [Mediterranea massiliensis]
MKTKQWILLIATLCFSFQSLSAIDIKRYVKVGGTGNGTSWENACGSIQQAIENCKVAGSGTVYIAEGVYYECVTFPSGTNNVKLLGSFPKDGGEKQSYRGTPSIIDGRNQPYCMQINHCQNVTVDGVLMRGGHTGSIPLNKLEPNHAGGLEMSYTTGVVSNCTFIDNNKYGLEVHEGVTVKNCIIGRNAGGVYCDDATVVESHILQNNGVGITLSGGSIARSNIYENKSKGVEAYGGHVLFCNIYNNRNDNKPGGGIHNQGVTNVYGCCIFNNTALKGAGIYSATGSILVESTTIVNNSASEGASGIHFENTKHSLAALILWNNLTSGKPAQFRFESTDRKSYMHHCAIQGGGELPETDAQLGIINLAAGNKVNGKPSPYFKNVLNKVGASVNNATMIEKQNFDLELGSACIGTGALAKQLEWYYNNDLSDRGINGQKQNKNHFNCGAYQETAEKYTERMGTISEAVSNFSIGQVFTEQSDGSRNENIYAVETDLKTIWKFYSNKPHKRIFVYRIENGGSVTEKNISVDCEDGENSWIVRVHRGMLAEGSLKISVLTDNEVLATKEINVQSAAVMAEQVLAQKKANVKVHCKVPQTLADFMNARCENGTLTVSIIVENKAMNQSALYADSYATYTDATGKLGRAKVKYSGGEMVGGRNVLKHGKQAFVYVTIKNMPSSGELKKLEVSMGSQYGKGKILLYDVVW